MTRAFAPAKELRAGGSSAKVRVWDLPLRLFHWLLVATIAVAFLSAEVDSILNQWHVLAGWVVAVLIVFRLAWGFVGGEHSRFADFIRPSGIRDHLSGLAKGRIEPSLGHNPLGAVAVVILLGLTAIVVWTGAFGGESAEDVHELVGWTLLAMIGVHIAAVIVMSLIERENLVRAMVTGTKQRTHHADPRDARRPGALAWVISAAVVAASVYAILQYDPQAFTLRAAEAFEHRGDAGSVTPVEEHHDDED